MLKKEYKELKKLLSQMYHQINVMKQFLMESLVTIGSILVVFIAIISMIVGVMLMMVKDFVLLSIQLGKDIFMGGTIPTKILLCQHLLRSGCFQHTDTA